MAHPAGETDLGQLRLEFDRRLNRNAAAIDAETAQLLPVSPPVALSATLRDHPCGRRVGVAGTDPAGQRTVRHRRIRAIRAPCRRRTGRNRRRAARLRNESFGLPAIPSTTDPVVKELHWGGGKSTGSTGSFPPYIASQPARSAPAIRPRAVSLSTVVISILPFSNALIVLPRKATIKRKFARAACPMPRAGDRMRAKCSGPIVRVGPAMSLHDVPK